LLERKYRVASVEESQGAVRPACEEIGVHQGPKSALVWLHLHAHR
jgi:hypothetical protein